MTEDPALLLIRALHDPVAYDHPVAAVRLVETHISWVLLTGDYAYKIKKPVNFGFLDFSTLARRRDCCVEELRLNRRFAPELYLGVVAIGGTPAAPRIVDAGADDAIEYAVKMREFPQQLQLDRVLARGELTRAHIATLAADLAAFHRAPAAAPDDSPYGTPEAVWQPMRQNFAQLRPQLDGRDERAQLDELERWSETRYRELHALLAQRRRDGCIRECHGDAHLGNIVLLADRPRLFDCIEFNPQLRWIDVISEIAFLTMDLHDRGRDELAHRALNDYVEASGDYAGLPLLRFYQVYRALVRAKVASLRLGQPGLADAERDATRAHAAAYLRLALRFTRPGPTPLMITHGLSGSGKTTLTDDVLESQGALRLRSDVERKRLHGLAPETRSGSAVGGGLYTAEASVRTYERLATLADTVLGAGLPVIVDAAFLKRAQREPFRRLAARRGVPFVIFDCSAPAEQLRARITARAAAARDASEATVAVLEQQLCQCEPLAADEAAHILTIRTVAPP